MLRTASANVLPEETFADIGLGHSTGFFLADQYAKKIQSMVDEAITVIETVKKIPDFNANLSVELAFSCASMKAFTSDPRADERYLETDEEPVSDNKFISNVHQNCFIAFQKRLCRPACLTYNLDLL